MRSVQSWIASAGRRHMCGTALVACASVFAAGCHAGVDTPVAPSAVSSLGPVDSNAVMDSSEEVATTRGGPISSAMTEVNESGYSGTCTIGSGGQGLRLRVAGEGTPNISIRYALRVVGTEDMQAYLVGVNDRGTFRGEWQRNVAYPSGTSVECLLLAWGASQETILAQGQPFLLP